MLMYSSCVTLNRLAPWVIAFSVTGESMKLLRSGAETMRATVRWFVLALGGKGRRARS